jgi:cell division protein FtsN
MVVLIAGGGAGYYFLQREQTLSPPQRAAPGARTAKAPQQPRPPAPRYEFYRLLPEMEVTVPQSGSGKRPAAPRKREPAKEAAASAKPPAKYLLQAGSFRSFGPADRLKAQLALLGIEANIQQVNRSASEKVYRVHIGPFQDLDRVAQVRSRLKHHSIDAIVLKKGG